MLPKKIIVIICIVILILIILASIGLVLFFLLRDSSDNNKPPKVSPSPSTNKNPKMTISVIHSVKPSVTISNKKSITSSSVTVSNSISSSIDKIQISKTLPSPTSSISITPSISLSSSVRESNLITTPVPSNIVISNPLTCSSCPSDCSLICPDFCTTTKTCSIQTFPQECSNLCPINCHSMCNFPCESSISFSTSPINNCDTTLCNSETTFQQVGIDIYVFKCNMLILLDGSPPKDPRYPFDVLTKFKEGGWAIYAFDILLGSLIKMYKLYQDVFAIIKQGDEIPELSGKYIKYSVRWIPAGGFSAPYFNGATVYPWFVYLDYNATKHNKNVLSHVFFYETTRNFNYVSKIDYNRAKEHQNFGWMVQGIINVLGSCVSNLIPTEFRYYSDPPKNRNEFFSSFLVHLDIYLQNTQYTFTDLFNSSNTFLPWSPNSSVDNLTGGLFIHLYNTYGEYTWARRFFRSLLLLPSSSLDDSQTSLDNYYLASSRAANQDLINFFGGDATEKGKLRWNISEDAKNTVQEFISSSNIVSYCYTGHYDTVVKNKCIDVNIDKTYITEDITNYKFYKLGECVC